MRFTCILIALGSCIPSSVAVALENILQGTVQQVEIGKTLRLHPALELYRTYLKFNGTAPKILKDAADAAIKGTATTVPEIFDSAYLTPVKIGTPGKVHHMDIDTASSDLWVFSSLQSTSQQSGHVVYDPAKSSTSRRVVGARWGLQYGDGSTARGRVYEDVVTVAGITVKQQAVEAATHVSSTFTGNKANDGLFGFAFSKDNSVRPGPVNVWFQNAKLAARILGADLRAGKPGSYDFGFVNKAHYSGTIHYTKISRANGFWEFLSDGFSVGSGKSISMRIDAIADTGTSIIVLPQAANSAYYSKVKGSGFNNQVGGYIFPCSAKLPSFSIIIAGSKRTVPGTYMNFQPIGTVGGKEYCLGGLQPNTGLRGMSIVGDVFLKSQYVVFDAESNKIGFANKA